MGLFCVILILLAVQATPAIDPAHFSEEVSSLLPKEVSLHQQDLARTVNGYNIIAYGLTAIPGLSPTLQFQDISYYPSSVIVSYMHGTDENAFNLLFGYVVNLLRGYETDYYIKAVLQTGFIWLVPFVSIDIFQFHTRIKDNANTPITRMKNGNRYPDNSNQIDCESQNKGKEGSKYSGVNLDYNFLPQQQSNLYSHVCSDRYAGVEPFSEMETKGIQKLFKELRVTAVVDLQMGDDKWVHPARQIWDHRDHQYQHLYRDVITKIEKVRTSISEQPTKVLPKHVYTGGFVNYASQQNSLAFKYLITSEGKGERLQRSVSSAYSIMDMLIKKNAPLYNKYLGADKKTLYVESLSLNNFTIRCEIIVGSGESVVKDYSIEVGKIVEVSLEPEYQSRAEANTKKDLDYSRASQVRLHILGTLLAELLNLQTIPPVSVLPADRIPASSSARSQGISLIQSGIVVLVILFVIGGGVLMGLKRSGQPHGRRGRDMKAGYEAVLEGSEGRF